MMSNTNKTECSRFTVANEQSMGHTCGPNNCVNFPPVTSVTGPYDGSSVFRFKAIVCGKVNLRLKKLAFTT